MPIKIKKCDLILIIHDALDEIIPIWGDVFNLHSDESLMGFWSSEQLQRAIENLASLAAKYRVPNSLVNISIFEDKSKYNIQIRYSGLAFNKDNAGLEMTLIKGFLKSHGGKFSVDTINENTNLLFSISKDCRTFPESRIQ